MRIAPLLAVCLGVLGACSVSSRIEQPPPGDTDVTTSAPAAHYLSTDFENDYTNAVCDWYVACGASVGSVFTDRDSCIALIQLTTQLTLQGDDVDVDDPTLYRVDADQAAACIQLVKSNPCNATVPALTDAPCDGVFVGRLNDGECCDGRGGCSPGLVCEVDPNGATHVGYCTAIGDVGETCYVQQCVPEASCQVVGGLQQCTVSLQLAAGVPCDDTFDCGAGLACQLPSSGTQTLCLTRPDLGDFCTPDLPCGSGLFCTGTSGTRCSATAGGPGDDCYADADCSSGLTCVVQTCVQPGDVGATCTDDPSQPCLPSLSCIDGACATTPVPVALGDACVPNGPACPGVLGGSACVLGLSGYTCVAAAQLGDPCGAAGEAQCSFAAGLTCDSTSQMCVALPQRGEPCPLGICASFFTDACAADGTCEQRIAVGSPCTPLPDEGDSVIVTECMLLAFCIPDSSSGQNVCTRVQSQDAGETCQ